MCLNILAPLPLSLTLSFFHLSVSFDLYSTQLHHSLLIHDYHTQLENNFPLLSSFSWPSHSLPPPVSLPPSSSFPLYEFLWEQKSCIKMKLLLSAGLCLGMHFSAVGTRHCCLIFLSPCLSASFSLSLPHSLSLSLSLAPLTLY